MGLTRRFASKLHSWSKWTQKHARPHNLLSSCFGRTVPGNLHPPGLCIHKSVLLEALGNTGEHLCCQQLDYTEMGDLTDRDSILGNPNHDLLDLGCTVFSIKSTWRKAERKIRANPPDVCCLLHKHFSQSQETGEAGLTCWQQGFHHIPILHTHSLDLKICSLHISKKGVHSLHYSIVSCINKSKSFLP